MHVSSDADEEMITWMKTPYLAGDALLLVGSDRPHRRERSAGRSCAARRRSSARWSSQEIATADDIDSIVEANPYMFMEYKDRVQNI